MPAVEQALAAAVSAGVESQCDCGFSPDRNLKQTVIQCFSDSPARVNALLLVQATPSRNTSEIVNFLKDWIATNPLIILDDRGTTVSIDSGCDVTVIQGSGCTSTTQTPPTPETTPSPSNQPTNENTTEPEPEVGAQTRGRDLTAVGGTLLAIALILVVVAAVVVVFVLVRYRVIRVRSFSV